MNKDCPKKRWPLLGCKFEPRHDYIQKFNHPFSSVKNVCEPASVFMNSLKTEDKIYVCDICVRCGERVER